MTQSFPLSSRLLYLTSYLVSPLTCPHPSLSPHPGRLHPSCSILVPILGGPSSVPFREFPMIYLKPVYFSPSHYPMPAQSHYLSPRMILTVSWTSYLFHSNPLSLKQSDNLKKINSSHTSAFKVFNGFSLHLA